jgi:hypothetical protein
MLTLESHDTGASAICCVLPSGQMLKQDISYFQVTYLDQLMEKSKGEQAPALVSARAVLLYEFIQNVMGACF